MIDNELKEKDVLWSITIESPTLKMNMFDMSHAEVDAIWRNIATTSKDPHLTNLMNQVYNSFGLMSISDGTNYRVGSSVKRIRTTVGDRHRCQYRLAESEQDMHEREEPLTLDRWEQFSNGERVCSFCGSLHPDDMLARLKKHGKDAIEPSSKNYKFYLGKYTARNAMLGPIKYYSWHNTEELVEELEKVLKGN